MSFVHPCSDAIPTFLPSVALVCRGCMDDEQEVLVSRRGQESVATAEERRYHGWSIWL